MRSTRGPFINAICRIVLEQSGYRVLIASGGEEAIRVYEEHEGPIHILLTDVVMPGMNGPQLAEVLTRRNRDLKILFMSGQTEDAVVRQGILEGQVAFLQKPFSPATLTRKIDEVRESSR